MKGLGYGRCSLLLAEQTSIISKNRQVSLYFAFTSLEYGNVLLPATACSTSISNRKPQADQLSDFLDVVKADPSYPARSDKITREAHDFLFSFDERPQAER